MSLDEFIDQRIVKPLGLSHTGFYVPVEKAGHIAEPQVDPKTLFMFDPTDRSRWPSGGGGMESTASDYGRFAQMLLNGGELDGVRLLSPRTVRFMTSDQLPPDIAFSPTTLQLFEPAALAPTPRDGQSFGLGFMVRVQPGRNPREGSPRDFFWQGLWGTDFWVDPNEKVVTVFMMQGPGEQGPHYLSVIRNLVYQALIK